MVGLACTESSFSTCCSSSRRCCSVFTFCLDIHSTPRCLWPHELLWGVLFLCVSLPVLLLLSSCLSLILSPCLSPSLLHEAAAGSGGRPASSALFNSCSCKLKCKRQNKPKRKTQPKAYSWDSNARKRILGSTFSKRVTERS